LRVDSSEAAAIARNDEPIAHDGTDVLAVDVDVLVAFVDLTEAGAPTIEQIPGSHDASLSPLPASA
jgi:hypothetical protein